MKTDYPEFKNKVVEFNIIAEKYTGLVVDCSYFAGISIVNKDNKHEFLACLSRKRCNDIHIPKSDYRKHFYSLVKDIHKGVVNVNLTSNSSNASMSNNCAFK